MQQQQQQQQLHVVTDVVSPQQLLAAAAIIDVALASKNLQHMATTRMSAVSSKQKQYHAG
jgi:hypothetical protein